MSETTTPADIRDERARKRRPIVALGLAALAVGGIGAAMTSAAWTDNVLFSAGAEAATFELVGAVGTGAYSTANGPDSVTLTIPASELANLIPGQTRTIPLHVRNDGSVPAALTSTAVFASGSTFTTNPTATVTDLGTSLAAGGTVDDFSLVVTTPSDWATTNQGKSGTIVVTITGTATAP